MKKYGLRRTDTNEYYGNNSKSGYWTSDIRSAFSWGTLKTINELFDETPGMRVRNNSIIFRNRMRGLSIEVVEFEITAKQYAPVGLWKSIT